MTAERRRSLTLVCASAPSFMIQLDANIVAVSLPSISRSVHASFAGIEWVITAYVLAFASLLMAGGALGDRYGRKPMLIVGICLFTLASLLCGLAQSLPVLVAARALQGAGAAFQLSSALATLSHAFRGAARARAFAFWGSVIGLAMALGPIVGGAITQGVGWQWAFYINVPIGLVLIALIVPVVEPSRDPDAERVDLPGVMTFGGALFLATLALIEGNREGWTTAAISAEAFGSVVLFGLFLAVERRQARPMLDLSFFRRPTYIGANISQFAFSAGVLTMLTFIPIYFQNGLGEAPTVAGLMMMPMVVPLMLVPRFVSRHLAHQLSGRALLAIGLAIGAAGLLWLALVVPDLAYPPMIGGMVVIGIGAGLLNGETTKVGMSVIPPERAGMASGVGGTVRFTGLVLGFAALGAVLVARIAAGLESARIALDAAALSTASRDIAAGHLATPGLDHATAMTLFASGYQAVFLAGAACMLLSAALSWWLVRAAETPPVSRSAGAGEDDLAELAAAVD